MGSESEVFDVCILCALPVEAKAFRNVVSQYCSVKFKEDFSQDNIAYLSATIQNDKGEPVKILLSWLPRYGSFDTTIYLQSLLSQFHPRFAAMTGICAGDKRKVKSGDLVIAERAFMVDTGKFVIDKDGQRVQEYDTYTSASARDVLQFTRLFEVDKDLIDQLRLPPVLESLSPRYHTSPMASSNAIHEDEPFQDVQVPVRGTFAIDMEGATFYRIVEGFPGMRSLIVKGVSNYADGDRNDTYQVYAAELSALYMLSFIKRYVRSDLMPRLRREEKPSGGSKAPTKSSSGRSKLPVTPSPVPSDAVRIFFSYTPEDEAGVVAVVNQLALLRRNGKIACWYSSYEDDDAAPEDNEYLNQARVILLFVSPNFIASERCDREVTRACALQAARKAIIIPIILRSTDNWESAPFGKLQPLPKGGKPVYTWSRPEEGFFEVAKGIREAAKL